MPTLGEIRKSEEIGSNARGQRWVWSACVDCGKERWVLIKGGQPRNIRCLTCSSKINGGARKGSHLTQETKDRLSQLRAGSGNPMFGKHHSSETKEKLSQLKKALFLELGDKWWGNNPKPSFIREGNPNYRGGKVVLCDNCGAELYRRPCRLKSYPGTQISRKHHFCDHKCMSQWQSQDKEFLSLAMKKRQPNKKEILLNNLLQELSLPYRYVGNGQFILGGKCPDFLNVNGQKKLIELFGDYWHKGENPQVRIDYFKQYGFDTLVIWECELTEPSKLEERLLTFNAVR